jgi:very-short-patch-repair endonuclease
MAFRRRIGLGCAIECAIHRRVKAHEFCGRVVVCRKRVPAEFVREANGLRFVSPAYAAVELAATDDGRAICEALRRRIATTDELKAALAAQSGSRGHVARRKVVAACLKNPWSYAELRLQRILTAAGIKGWKGNPPLTLSGRCLHPDVLFLQARVVVEFDGRETHNSTAQFLKDRERLNILVAHGYLVLRFGWEHLDDPDYIVRTVLHALSSSARW